MLKKVNLGVPATPNPSSVGQFVGQAIGKVQQMARILHGKISKLGRKVTTGQSSSVDQAASESPQPKELQLHSTASDDEPEVLDDSAKDAGHLELTEVGTQESQQDDESSTAYITDQETTSMSIEVNMQNLKDTAVATEGAEVAEVKAVMKLTETDHTKSVSAVEVEGESKVSTDSRLAGEKTKKTSGVSKFDLTMIDPENKDEAGHLANIEENQIGNLVPNVSGALAENRELKDNVATLEETKIPSDLQTEAPSKNIEVKDNDTSTVEQTSRMSPTTETQGACVSAAIESQTVDRALIAVRDTVASIDRPLLLEGKVQGIQEEILDSEGIGLHGETGNSGLSQEPECSTTDGAEVGMANSNQVSVTTEATVVCGKDHSKLAGDEGINDGEELGVSSSEVDSSVVTGVLVAKEETQQPCTLSVKAAVKNVSLDTEKTETEQRGSPLTENQSEKEGRPTVETDAQKMTAECIARQAKEVEEQSKMAQAYPRKTMTETVVLDSNTSVSGPLEKAMADKNVALTMNMDASQKPAVAESSENKPKPQDTVPNTSVVSEASSSQKAEMVSALNVQSDNADIPDTSVTTADQVVSCDTGEDTSKGTSSLTVPPVVGQAEVADARDKSKLDQGKEYKSDLDISVNTNTNIEKLSESPKGASLMKSENVSQLLELSKDYVSKEDLLCQAQLKAVTEEDEEKPPILILGGSVVEAQVSSVQSSSNSDGNMSSIKPQSEPPLLDHDSQLDVEQRRAILFKNKGLDEQSELKDLASQPDLLKDSGSREWCAKEVKEGKKIVLRLKRKPSLEKESSAPTTPTATDIEATTMPATSSDQRNPHRRVSGDEKQAVGKQAALKTPEVTPKDPPQVGKTLAESSPPNERVMQENLTQGPVKETIKKGKLSDWRRRKKKRRSEIELLNETERPKRRKPDVSAGIEDAQVPNVVNEEAQTCLSETSHEEESIASSVPEVESTEVVTECVENKAEEKAAPGMVLPENNLESVPLPTPESEEKLEKLVIKRRIPSPTKMKTRGKQNRLWYLFAKQSKPSKGFLPVEQVEQVPMRGPVDEMLGLCKPCHVVIVDFIKCLELLKQQKPPTSDANTDVDSASDQLDVEKDQQFPESDSFKLDIQLMKQSEDEMVTEQTKSVGDGDLSGDPRLDVPEAKKPKLEEKSDFEKHFLNFIMPEQRKPVPVLDRTARKTEGDAQPQTSTLGHPTQPKPVLSRSPVTARKSIQGGSRRGNIRRVPVKQYPLRGQENKKTIQESGTIQGGRIVEKTAEQTSEQSVKKIADSQKVDPNVCLYKCRHCTYTTEVMTMMKDHVYTHLDAVSFTCGHCGAFFSSRSGVIVHNRQDHPALVSHIIKNTDFRVEHHYIELDNGEQSHSGKTYPEQAANASSPGGIAVEKSQGIVEPVPAAGAPHKAVSQAQSVHPTPVLSKSVSLLNPAALTAQVNAARVGSSSVLASPVAATSLSTTNQVAPMLAEPHQLVTPKDLTNAVTAEALSKRERPKVPRRPRIPLLDNVDPNQPYYQCRHCTYASNGLKTIKTHVHKLHKKEQCYQCPLCELAFYKSGTAMAKHYANKHPGEPVLLKLQPDYYDVHQQDLENPRQTIKQWLSNKGVDETQSRWNSDEGISPRGQSPLHIIVSPDRITVMGASEVSPETSGLVRAKNSPQISPLSSQSGGHGSPAPAHTTFQPRPVLSPPPAHQSKLYVSPKNVDNGNSGFPSPDAAEVKSVSRVILKVPNISPPVRHTSLGHTSPASSMATPPITSSPSYAPTPSAHQASSSTEDGTIDVMDLSIPSPSEVTCMDLSTNGTQARQHREAAVRIVSTSEVTEQQGSQIPTGSVSTESSTTIEHLPSEGEHTNEFPGQSQVMQFFSLSNHL